MKITWLGQVSLLIETGQSVLLVDPYLTDSIYEARGEEFRRLVPLRPEYLFLKPDMILLTHDHADHLDPPSLKHLLPPDRKTLVLAGANAWNQVRREIGGPHNYVQMQPGCEWTQGDISVRAVVAYHSDSTALGYVITAEGRTLYITGDSLYSRELARQVGQPIDVLITVVNGMGNNMNGTDGARLAADLKPKVSIPVHWGLFAKYSDTPAEFEAACKERNLPVRVLQIYERADLEEVLKGASL